MFHHNHCSCDIYVHCIHKPVGWVPPPRPGQVQHHIHASHQPCYTVTTTTTYHKTPTPQPIVLQSKKCPLQKIPPPPGPGRVVSVSQVTTTNYKPPPQYIPPPPGPGQVIPDYALPHCGHNSRFYGCSHCNVWQWR
ncbi:probable pathogenesis-related protein ARB_02861 isoform X1 [Dendroctonus ponderosae]|uniref:Uncharacterized protein n=1 Tax=Dendroctonus ponderosae TaxID=77166 RepID=U4UF59_DENPD|nr:probable pathogenesis-related protein ARB_02861 isoform X1 [Dendroctonus ponderosae]ERL88550.1 hypothetical protein D910_05935 [Dendroctonus ponderosae]KAH1018881.1 hypothetical protein HUJ05_006566 [Dendroctonus ponderosae]